MPQKKEMTEKQATIVSAEWNDLYGSTGDSDLSQLARMLETLMDIVEKVADYNGGKVTQSAGLNFLLIFSDRNSEKENISSALETILEVQRKLAGLSEEIKSESIVRFSAGISSGLIIRGSSGSPSSRRETLMGDTVELAIRIRQIANAGQVLADSVTYKLSKDLYKFDILEPVPVKGMEEPLPLFRLAGKIDLKPSLKAGPGRLIQSKMIGREEEKEQMIASLVALTKGKGGIINIVGPPGTGKSRLVAEVKKEKIIDRLQWFEGRGLSHGHNLSYHPFAGIIKSWAGIKEEDNPAEAERKLKSEIERVFPDGTEDIFPFIARFMGLTLGGAAGGRIRETESGALDKLMLKAIRDLLIKASGIKPFVIAIEDLHWADQSSLGLLRSLYELSRNHPILFINIMRPGYEETSDPLFKFFQENHPDHLIKLEITNLDPEHSEKLMSNLILAGQIPGALIREIIAKTGGNPFFIEEVLRSLIDQGHIEFANNVFKINDTIGSVNIPETINEVLLSRVENLDEKTRNLLDTASVIGRNFYFKVLDEAADAIGEVSERLEYLKNMQFIQDSGDEGKLEYVFKHALAHQAAYDSMMDKKRKSLHLKIAESIEKVFPERINEFYGTLAMHYSKAENYIKAEEYLMKAGEEAVRSAASAEAIDFYKEALRIYLINSEEQPDAEHISTLHLNIAINYYALGLNIEALDYFDKILRSYSLKISRPLLPSILIALKNIIILIYSLNFPKQRFRRRPSDLDNKLLSIYFHRSKALSTLNPRKAFFEGISIINYATRFNLKKSEYSLTIFPIISVMFSWTGISMKLSRKILDFTSKNITSMPNLVWMEYNVFAKLYNFLVGHWKEDEQLEEIHEYCISKGSIWNLLNYLLFCGFQFMEMGMKDRTIDMVNRLERLGEDFNMNLATVQYFRLFSVMSFKYRMLDENISLAEKGISFTSKTGHSNMLSMIILMKAASLALKGEIDKAKSTFWEGEKLAMERKIIKIWYSATYLTRCYIELEELKRNPMDAVLRKSIVKTGEKSIKASSKVINNLIESHRLNGTIHCVLGNYKKSIQHFKKSMELAEKAGAKVELSRIFFETSKCLSKPNNNIQTVKGLNGKEYLAKARLLFIEMKLEYDLAELERFLNK